MGLRERCKLAQRGPEQSSGDNRNLASETCLVATILFCFCTKQNVVIEANLA